ncbi:MAG: T9SS type A sorting domain-containing protein [Caldithrix sp.]|nr:T9SS type A sorting domain-containing protein [Caldithrix sp.]
MDSTKWELTVIDSGYAEGGRWGIIDVANLDDDPNDEVVYTSSIPAGGLFGGTQPLVILENTQEVATGPWHKMELDYTYEGVLDSLGAPHGIVVDMNDNIWIGSWSEDAVVVVNSDGEEQFRVDSVNTTTPAGGDTTIYLSACRGMDVDPDGNIIYAQSGSVIKLDYTDGSILDWVPFNGSPLKPAVDDDGFIYVGLVVGVTPVSVIDPSTFEITQQIELDPLAGGFARGMEVTDDGKRLIPGNLDAAIHSLYVYETEDFINYPLVDSIRYDDMGNPIFESQSVTLDWSRDGKMWVSQDNSYGGGGADQMINALVMFNWDNMDYGYLWMPEPVPAESGYTGPRGVAWSQDGKKAYVASWNAGAVYVFDTSPVSLEARDGTVVTDYHLEQNYPNPFNPETNIEFTVAKAGKVSLKIYNMLGQEVTTLVDRNMPRGQFNVKFDGSNLASGVYIYKLEAGDFTMSKKMMLIK